MNTPIYDFVSRYIASGSSRLHMPGHKGRGPLHVEQRDITEIKGADVLSEACGIIGESESNASALFGSAMTAYSTEGSSLCIRAMLYLILQRRNARAGASGGSGRPVVLAARNAHKSFLSACAMLDFEIVWLYPEEEKLHSLCSFQPSPAQVLAALRSMKRPPLAVYLTSPDYLGALADVRGVASACASAFREDFIPLLVDNAHGAYLHFLETPSHPMDCGAYLCCDSAHKTLPCLTGGAYLHLSARAAEEVGSLAHRALALFASSSPSYLVLQSLDLCNERLSRSYRQELASCVSEIRRLKEQLRGLGVKILPGEPLKLTVDAAPQRGEALAELMRENGMEPEFADVNYLVCMLTADTPLADYRRLENFFRDLIKKRSVLPRRPPLSLQFFRPPRACSVREAMLAPQEMIPVRESAGRICGQPSVACPPAVPLAVSGERITEEMISLFLACGVTEIAVLR